MSQAVIDFCEGLKATLLNIEDRLGKAKEGLDVGASGAQLEAKKHVEEATAFLEAFKLKAAQMALSLRTDLPEKSKPIRETLHEFGLEAQVAMRHAVVFLAEAASKGAEGASVALKEGAQRAQTLAQGLRHDTAVTLATPADTDSPKTVA